MQCPIDNQQLQHLPVARKFLSKIHLDVCKTCQGVWVDSGELSGLMSHFTSDHKKTYKEWLKAEHDGKTAPKDFWQESERKCPRDGEVMRRHYSGAAHQVGIDQCQKCGGFWFDGSELYAVAKAVEPNRNLDMAVSSMAGEMHDSLDRKYSDKDVQFWDLTTQPKSVLPILKDVLLSVMVAFLVRS